MGAASAAFPFSVLFMGNPSGTQQDQRRAFSDGLIELDLVPGTTFEINNWGLFGAFEPASEMVQRLSWQGLICTLVQAAAMAAVNEARVYPNFHVIMLDATDAVEMGFVDSLEISGRSVTGLIAADTTPRLVQLARTLAPEVAPVGMILNISNPLHTLHVGHALDTQAGAPLVRADLAGPEGIEAAFKVRALVQSWFRPTKFWPKSTTRSSQGPGWRACLRFSAQPETLKAGVWRQFMPIQRPWQGWPPTTSPPFSTAPIRATWRWRQGQCLWSLTLQPRAPRALKFLKMSWPRQIA